MRDVMTSVIQVIRCVQGFFLEAFFFEFSWIPSSHASRASLKNV